MAQQGDTYYIDQYVSLQSRASTWLAVPQEQEGTEVWFNIEYATDREFHAFAQAAAFDGVDHMFAERWQDPWLRWHAINDALESGRIRRVEKPDGGGWLLTIASAQAGKDPAAGETAGAKRDLPEEAERREGDAAMGEEVRKASGEEETSEEQQKARLIATMYDLHPELRGQGDDPQGFDLSRIVDGMTLGIATHPECDDLIPALQAAMDFLGEGGKAQAAIDFWRLPNVLPPIRYSSKDDLTRVARLAISQAEGWIEKNSPQQGSQTVE